MTVRFTTFASQIGKSYQIVAFIVHRQGRLWNHCAKLTEISANFEGFLQYLHCRRFYSNTWKIVVACKCKLPVTEALLEVEKVNNILKYKIQSSYKIKLL